MATLTRFAWKSSPNGALAVSASGGSAVALQPLCDDHSPNATVSWP